MYAIGVLILTDARQRRFLDTDVNERAALTALRAGIGHIWFLGDVLPDQAMRERLERRGLVVTGSGGWSRPLTGAPPARVLIVLPATTLIDADALKRIARKALDSPHEPAIVVDRRQVAGARPADASHRCRTTGIVMLPMALVPRLRSVDDVRELIAGLGPRARRIGAASRFCAVLGDEADTAGIERDYLWSATSRGPGLVATIGRAWEFARRGFGEVAQLTIGQA